MCNILTKFSIEDFSINKSGIFLHISSLFVSVNKFNNEIILNNNNIFISNLSGINNSYISIYIDFFDNLTNLYLINIDNNDTIIKFNIIYPQHIDFKHHQTLKNIFGPSIFDTIKNFDNYSNSILQPYNKKKYEQQDDSDSQNVHQCAHQ